VSWLCDERLASSEAPRPSTDLPLSSLWLLRALSPNCPVLLVGIVLLKSQAPSNHFLPSIKEMTFRAIHGASKGDQYGR
jgi:hypothetical protein